MGQVNAFSQLKRSCPAVSQKSTFIGPSCPSMFTIFLYSVRAYVDNCRGLYSSIKYLMGRAHSSQFKAAQPSRSLGMRSLPNCKVHTLKSISIFQWR